MRGALILLAIAGLILAGCTGQPPSGNETNQSNVTPPAQNCTGPVCGTDFITYPTDCEAAVANATVAYAGECEAPETCNDTDEGLETTTPGSVTLGNGTYTDSCDADGKLLEYTCQDNNVVMVVYDCGDGMECSGGKCVQLPPPPEQNETNASAGCTGPTEPNVYKKESATYNGSVYNDTCTEYRVVKDYYCQNNALQWISNQCQPGFSCSNGFCQASQYTCTETDDGNDTTARGHVIVTKGIATILDEFDECDDLEVLIEYSCLENGTALKQVLNCPNGTKCTSGRCVKSDCTDSDGGKDIFKKGVVRAGGRSYEDECFNAHVMREYYCYGDEALVDLIDCGKGYICNADTATCVEGSVDE